MMKILLLFYMCHFAMGLTHCYKTTVFLHLLRVCTVLEAMTRVYENTENSTPSKYKIATRYSNAAQNIWLRCGVELCKIQAKPAHQIFCWENRGSLSVLLTHTHDQSVKQILSSRLQITNMEGSKTFMAQNTWFHAQMCLLGYRRWQIINTKNLRSFITVKAHCSWHI